MSTSESSRAAELLHLRSASAAKGDPLAPPLVMASMYHLPGDPAGHAQYGRADNATIEELERALGRSHRRRLRAPFGRLRAGRGSVERVTFRTRA